MSTDNLSRLDDYLPVVIFIVSFFIFGLFDWHNATRFIWASGAALLVHLGQMHILRTDKKLSEKSLRRLNFHSGALSLTYLLVFIAGYMHWQRILPIYWRWAILMIILIVFFAIMFHSIRLVVYLKETSDDKK